MCDNKEDSIAPFTPIIGINNILKISFIMAPNANAITGILTFPNPCNAPFIVWVSTTNITVKDAYLSISAPDDAFGNKRLNICSENKYIHIVHGIPINIVTNIENSILRLATCISLFAIAAEIVGTNAVANAMLNENGNVINVSTFPLRIPYCSVAFSSPIISFKILTTVKASIVFVVAEKSAHKAIGIDTDNILFIILITLSFFCFVDLIISFQNSFFLSIKYFYK